MGPVFVIPCSIRNYSNPAGTWIFPILKKRKKGKELPSISDRPKYPNVYESGYNGYPVYRLLMLLYRRFGLELPGVNPPFFVWRRTFLLPLNIE
jgi:hypothetical protein